mmetsp:Transcript_58595/g.163460  ORF Transcript_58595/g.163460 Transcript_58595/m.163460 type:complete len:105 (-) Transcript_58595:919-1233(-)
MEWLMLAPSNLVVAVTQSGLASTHAGQEATSPPPTPDRMQCKAADASARRWHCLSSERGMSMAATLSPPWDLMAAAAEFATTATAQKTARPHNIHQEAYNRYPT